MSLEALDLFSGGAGGWTLALHRLGIRTAAALDALEAHGLIRPVFRAAAA